MNIRERANYYAEHREHYPERARIMLDDLVKGIRLMVRMRGRFARIHLGQLHLDPDRECEDCTLLEIVNDYMDKSGGWES